MNLEKRKDQSKVPVLNIEQMDDAIVYDGVGSFVGGQVSGTRANLLTENESAQLVNCDVTLVLGNCGHAGARCDWLMLLKVRLGAVHRPIVLLRDCPFTTLLPPNILWLLAMKDQCGNGTEQTGVLSGLSLMLVV